jgi:hypothetical protein
METFKAHFGTMDASSATHHAAGDSYTAAGSVDVAALFAALATAIGPIGARDLLPAAASVLPNPFGAATKLGDLHHAHADATTSAKATTHASDKA